MEPSAKLIIERAKTTKEVYEILDTRGQEFQIFFADLLMPEDSTEGLRVVEYVSGTFPKMVVIGISKAEGSHPGTSEKFKRHAGADSWFFDKRLLKKSDYSFQQVREELVATAKKKGYLISDAERCDIEWKPEQVGNEKLDAEIDSIGLERLRKILKQIAAEMVKFTPRYLTPGLSGATVLRVIAEAPNKPPLTLLVKFSTDQPKLERELAAAPKTGEPSSNVYVPYIPSSTPWSHEGMFAIAGRFEDDAITLEQWLTDSTINPSDTVQDVFSELFLHGLGKAYHNSKSVGGATAMEFLKPNVRTRARILLSLEVIEELLPRSGRTFDLKTARDFVRFNGQINTHPATAYPRETSICWSHGDLHTRNILIDQSARSRPKVIDTARRSERHWASDPARLSADLWMTTWDHGPDSHFWESLDIWREQVILWRHERSIKVDKRDPNRRVWEALNWIKKNLGTLFDLSKAEFAEWQFDLALSMELLAMSSYSTVPMPKRCFGVLAASDILNELDQSIPWL
jgi:hypothetical protein